jgi:polysaccharide biosynthesis protein PslF
MNNAVRKPGIEHRKTAGRDRLPANVLAERPPIGPATVRSVGILSTYPPTQCGVATFTSSLRAALIKDRPDLRVEIVRIGATESSRFDSDVTHVLTTGSGDSPAAAAAMNQFDVAVVQHEFGIYDGDDGEQVLDVVAATRVPVVVVAHTVPARPTANQRRILESLVRAADAVVTLSGAGRRRLMDSYQVDLRKLMLIPHGAPAAAPRRQTVSAGPGLAILTWGLLGPGKGVEWGISALAEMDTSRLQPTYIVAGQTHPKVLARDGERYRDSLAEQAERHGVSRRVQFEAGYVSDDRLRELLWQADVVLLPYDSHEQVTSGVLIEAMAAGIPVVSTAFPHAIELLADGKGGLLVPHADPIAIAAALTRIAAEPGLARAMSAHNASWKTAVGWPTVARQYRQVFDRLPHQRPRPIR